jgi:hypothetical protein
MKQTIVWNELALSWRYAFNYRAMHCRYYWQLCTMGGDACPVYSQYPCRSYRSLMCRRPSSNRRRSRPSCQNTHTLPQLPPRPRNRGRLPRKNWHQQSNNFPPVVANSCKMPIFGSKFSFSVQTKQNGMACFPAHPPSLLYLMQV